MQLNQHNYIREQILIFNLPLIWIQWEIMMNQHQLIEIYESLDHFVNFNLKGFNFPLKSRHWMKFKYFCLNLVKKCQTVKIIQWTFKKLQFIFDSLLVHMCSNFTRSNIFPSLFCNKNGILWSQARTRIEMRLRCYLVIGNMQLVIGNRQLAIGHWQKAEGNRKKTICNWTDQSSVLFLTE